MCYKEVGLRTSEQFNNRLASFLGQPARSTPSIKKPIKKSLKKPIINPKTRTMRTKRVSK